MLLVQRLWPTITGSINIFSQICMKGITAKSMHGIDKKKAVLIDAFLLNNDLCSPRWLKRFSSFDHIFDTSKIFSVISVNSKW